MNIFRTRKSGIQQSTQISDRLMALEGVRGLAAVVVVVFHAIAMFYPAFTYGLVPSLAKFHNSHFEEVLYGNPISVFISGAFAVSIFFVLSGFVLTITAFKTGDENIVRKLAAKRYIRLMLPALVSILITWLILSLGLSSAKDATAEISGSLWLDVQWNFVPNLLDALRQGIWGIFAIPETTYNPVLWTMQYEMIGSIIVFALFLLFGKTKYRWVIYVFAIALLFQTWYLAFVIGMVIADLYANKMFLFKNINKGVMTGLLLFGLLLGGYPSISGQNTFYQFMTIPGMSESQNQSFYLSIGASLVIIAVLTLPFLGRIFGSKIISSLGKYTFSLYLVHTAVLFTVGSLIFVHLYEYFGINQAAPLAILLTIPSIIIATYLFERFVDAPSIRLSNMFAIWVLGNLKDDKRK